MCIQLKRLRFSSFFKTNRPGNKKKNFKFKERKWYLNNKVVLVVLDTDSAESTVHAIQVVYIAFIFGATTVQLACFKEALSEQSFQPLGPHVVIFIMQIKIKSQLISTNHMNDLISHNNNNNMNNNSMNNNNDNNNNMNNNKIEFYLVTRKI